MNFFCKKQNTKCEKQSQWTIKNPNKIIDSHFQNQLSLNVWCDIIGDQLIAPFIIQDHPTGIPYEDSLQDLSLIHI